MNEVVENRKNELVNEVFDIDQQIKEMENRIESLKRLKELRMMEYQMMEQYDDRAIIQAKTGRKTTSDRMNFEDCLISICDKYGRPMKMKEIISAVEQFGFTWSKYQTAYAFISNSDLVQATGEHGYYNILAKRGW